MRRISGGSPYGWPRVDGCRAQGVGSLADRLSSAGGSDSRRWISPGRLGTFTPHPFSAPSPVRSVASQFGSRPVGRFQVILCASPQESSLSVACSLRFGQNDGLPACSPILDAREVMQMAGYFAVVQLNGTRTVGAQRKSPGDARQDALAALLEHDNVEVSIERCGEPRVGNRGRIDSFVSESGHEYDLVPIEVFSRRKV